MRIFACPLCFDLVAICIASSVFTPIASVAGQIGIDAFTHAAITQDFESLGPASVEYTPPIVIGGDAYDADGNILVSSSKLGPVIGRSGVAIGNNADKSNASVGFINIELGEPALRAGLYVGFEFPWAASVQFFAPGSTLLGTIAVSGTGRDSHFAGWQADAGSIARVRIVDEINNGRSILVDDFIREVPEPSSGLALIISTIGASGCVRCRNRSSVVR